MLRYNTSMRAPPKYLYPPLVVGYSKVIVSCLTFLRDFMSLEAEPERWTSYQYPCTHICHVQHGLIHSLLKIKTEIQSNFAICFQINKKINAADSRHSYSVWVLLIWRTVLKCCWNMKDFCISNPLCKRILKWGSHKVSKFISASFNSFACGSTLPKPTADCLTYKYNQALKFCLQQRECLHMERWTHCGHTHADSTKQFTIKWCSLLFPSLSFSNGFLWYAASFYLTNSNETDV